MKLEMDRAARDPQHAGLAMPKLLLCHLQQCSLSIRTGTRILWPCTELSLVPPFIVPFTESPPSFTDKREDACYTRERVSG